MVKGKKLITSAIIFITVLVIGLIAIKYIQNDNGQKLATKENNEKVNNDISQEKNENVVLTISSNYDINKISLDEIKNNKDYYVVIGKITTLDGTTNYNTKKNEYTTTFSLGNLEVIQDLKGNMKDNSIDIMKRGGKISLEQYANSLTDAQRQKPEMQNLLTKYSKQRANVLVESISLNEVDIDLNKEYIFTLYYNEDFGRYLIEAFPYALKDIRRENSKIYLVENEETRNIEEFYGLEQIFE